MIKFTKKGDFSKLNEYLKAASREEYFKNVGKYGQMGVEALAEATPKDSGITAASWHYRTSVSDSSLNLSWNNDNNAQGWFNVAMMLQLGHGTGTGGFVPGTDYINPAMQPVFDKIIEDLCKEVVKL